MDELEKHVIEMARDIKYIRKTLDGNGTKGLVSNVSENTEFRNRAIGGMVIIGGIGVGNIFLTLIK